MPGGAGEALARRSPGTVAPVATVTVGAVLPVPVPILFTHAILAGEDEAGRDEEWDPYS